MSVPLRVPLPCCPPPARLGRSTLALRPGALPLYRSRQVDDYVTEKIWESYLAGSIPVYSGAPNVMDYVPGAHTFIRADDFDLDMVGPGERQGTRSSRAARKGAAQCEREGDVPRFMAEGIARLNRTLADPELQAQMWTAFDWSRSIALRRCQEIHPRQFKSPLCQACRAVLHACTDRADAGDAE